MAKTVIKVENLSKMYDLGLVGTGTLSRDLNRTWARMLGKPDPYATLAEINDRTKVSKSGSVWALKEINFEVQEGEVLGIIGKNGAGKSTLLKILSQITSPTKGIIKIKGRVASLLEVGTGMHPEMTARQNIYLNGAIMGMTRREINLKFDEIVDFAGIVKYVDTPIKRFSSGMQVRLGFAVAAFLEPEILIIDEVLAVGDAEFQRKAIGKMQDVSKNVGRTVLFVSHNMIAVKTLCNMALLIDQGSIISRAETSIVVDQYLTKSQFGVRADVNKTSPEGDITLISIEIPGKSEKHLLNIDEKNMIRVALSVNFLVSKKFHVNLFFKDGGDGILFVIASKPENLQIGRHHVEYIFPKDFLNDIVYNIDILVVEDSSKPILSVKDAFMIEGNEVKRDSSWMGKYPGVIRPAFLETQTYQVKE